MKEIRIEGLRSIQDSGNIPIKPITILLGENSSGKSTLLRTFPLLRQSIESVTRGPILWYGPYVDFGVFEDAISKFSNKRTISFTFLMGHEELKKIPYHRIGKTTWHLDSDIEIKLSLTDDQKDKSTRISSVSISYKKNFIHAEFNRQSELTRITVNEMDVTKFFNGTTVVTGENVQSILPYLILKKKSQYLTPFDDFTNEGIHYELVKLIKPFLHGKSNEFLTSRCILDLPILPPNDFLKKLQNISTTSTWKSRTSCLSTEEKEFKEIYNYFLANRFTWLLLVMNRFLVLDFKSTKYIAPLRATAERYYRAQDLSVKEVDFQGKNLAMFINNLGTGEKNKLSTWLIENFGFDLSVKSDGGHLSLSLSYKDSDSSYNITDMGFGFSQVLPIITQLWYSGHNEKQPTGLRSSYIVIEQPELHLHPRLQAKMMDVFVKTIKLSKENGFKLNLIIETHSETLVNQVGHHISQSNLSHDDTSVIIFEKKGPDQPTNVTLSHFDKNGLLTNWPWGFFEPELH